MIYTSVLVPSLVFIESLEHCNPFLFTYCAVYINIISTAKADGAAPGFQHPPPPIQPSGEDPSDGRASHRSGQQQRMDQIDGVQSHEQLSKLWGASQLYCITLYHFISVQKIGQAKWRVCICRSLLSLETAMCQTHKLCYLHVTAVGSPRTSLGGSVSIRMQRIS